VTFSAPELRSAQTSIAVGLYPTSVAVRWPRAYVLNSGQRTISMIDAVAHTLVGTSAPMGREPRGALIVNAAGTRLYVPDPRATNVIVVDAATLSPVGRPIPTGRGPSAMVTAPDGSRLYIADSTAGTVLVFDTATGGLCERIPVGGGAAWLRSMAVSPDGARVYVADTMNSRIWVIDTGVNPVSGAPIAAGAPPRCITVGPDGTHAYAATSAGNVLVIDTRTSTVTTSIPVTPGSVGLRDIVVSTDGQRLYVLKSDDVVVIDTSINDVIGAIRIDGTPWANESIAMTPTGRLYVPVFENHTVEAIAVG
jgi:YVTN family beta-propeller protein